MPQHITSIYRQSTYLIFDTLKHRCYISISVVVHSGKIPTIIPCRLARIYSLFGIRVRRIQTEFGYGLISNNGYNLSKIGSQWMCKSLILMYPVLRFHAVLVHVWSYLINFNLHIEVAYIGHVNIL